MSNSTTLQHLAATVIFSVAGLSASHAFAEQTATPPAASKSAVAAKPEAKAPQTAAEALKIEEAKTLREHRRNFGWDK